VASSIKFTRAKLANSSSAFGVELFIETILALPCSPVYAGCYTTLLPASQLTDLTLMKYKPFVDFGEPFEDTATSRNTKRSGQRRSRARGKDRLRDL
jgi:hypothetical protein